MTLSYLCVYISISSFVTQKFFSLDIDLAAHLLQVIAPTPAHHLLVSADTRIPVLILGVEVVLAPDHVLGLPLAGLTIGTHVAGENRCALFELLYHDIFFGRWSECATNYIMFRYL